MDGEGVSEAGRGVTGGETDTELVEAVVSDGVGRDCWVHTSDTGATMAETWVEGMMVLLTGAAATGGAFGVVAGLALVASLFICDWGVNTHTKLRGGGSEN
jgi:hypothetical protein